MMDRWAYVIEKEERNAGNTHSLRFSYAPRYFLRVNVR